MTRKGFSNLQRQAEEMRARLPELQKAISEAREKGDLSENAEYHAARENLGMQEAKIREMEERLSQAEIIREGERPRDEIVLGARVLVLDTGCGDREEYLLVGMGEEDPMNNRILTGSPMGRAMLNKKKGDVFVVDAPGGRLNYRVLEISYD